MISPDDLKAKKALLEQKSIELKAEEKFLVGERSRLLERIKELGCSSLNDVTALKDTLSAELENAEKELEALLAELEKGVIINEPKDSQVINPVLSAIDDL